MQIDIAYMVRRLTYLDAAISTLMEKHELEALWMREKPTIDKAKERRKYHFVQQTLEQNLKKDGVEQIDKDGSSDGNASMTKQKINIEEHIEPPEGKPRVSRKLS